MRLTSRQLSEHRRRAGQKGAAVANRRRRELTASGQLKPRPRRWSRTWKRRMEPEVIPLKTKVLPCYGIPARGPFPFIDCNVIRTVTYGKGSGRGIKHLARCRSCHIATLYRRQLSSYEPEVVIAEIKKLWSEKKIGRVAKKVEVS